MTPHGQAFALKIDVIAYAVKKSKKEVDSISYKSAKILCVTIKFMRNLE